MPRCVLVKKRSADREPTTHVRTRRTTKRPKRNKFLVNEEVGDFIVVDTGTVGDTGTIGGTRNKFLVDEEVGDFIVVDTGTIGDTGTVEDIGRVGDTETVEDTGTVEDENPKPTSASVCCDATGATLQGDGTAIQNKHRKSDIDPDAIQKARDALFVLESIPDLVEKERNRPPNSISLYCPSPDRESQQSRITRPSINARQSAPATERSSDLGPFRSHTQDSDMSDVPQAFLQSPCQTSRQNIVAGEPWTDSLTSHHDQPAQQLSKLRSDDASKASQSQGIAPFDPNKPRQSSIGITSTNNSIGQATGLMRRPLPEQNPHTSLPVSNFPTLSSTPPTSQALGPLMLAAFMLSLFSLLLPLYQSPRYHLHLLLHSDEYLLSIMARIAHFLLPMRNSSIHLQCMP
ncbi:hypothetical protein B0J14DRAFT_567030 [Halenospora varia]|nr:hypothetical protein B0J14DRAFT_566879 [Halenospora varia]KAH6668527.1 hypothetical protein B0J14DRAFT_567030 [Halenospora varia]